ncbi:MAG: universal stress protein [Desulfovermiculus sp.]|nr:universal stress protein [Desulfovermiculus sp.]
MIPKIEKILYATDFSENSRISIDWAMALARKHDAKLLALNVIEDVAALAPNIQMYFTTEEWEKMKKRNETEAIEQTKQRMQSFCDNVQADTPECEYVADEILVRRGSPIEEIVAAATENTCDIIVLGTTGGHGLTDAIMGSTARGVLRRSPIPVLAVPMSEKQD